MKSITFKEEIKMFDNYYVYIDKKYNGIYNDFGVEARKKLCQIDKIVKRIEILDSKLGEFPQLFMKNYTLKQASKKLTVKSFKDLEELEFLSECFYYFAHRLIKVIKLLPGLKKFESKRIIIVRNQLIEHPEGKSSGVVMSSFACGGNSGPVIKGARYSSQINIHKDSGLYVNAKGLKDNLNIILKQVFNYGNQTE